MSKNFTFYIFNFTLAFAALAANAAADSRRKILTLDHLGVFIQPPAWAPAEIDGRYIPWGLHATNETLRATTQTGSVVPSLVDGYYERYAVRSEVMPSGGLLLTTNGVHADTFDLIPRELWPSNCAMDSVGVVSAWDGYPGGVRAMTNSLRFVEFPAFVAVRGLMRPDFLDYGGYELERLLIEAGLTISPPIGTGWDTTLDLDPSHWINVLPRLRDLRYDGIVRRTASLDETYPRNHLEDWLGGLEGWGADIEAEIGVMLGVVGVVPLGAATNYPATKTGGYDLRDLMVWWRGGTRDDATSWLRAYTNRALRLDWNAAGAAAYLTSQMDRSYFAVYSSAYMTHDFETATVSRNYDNSSSQAPTATVLVNRQTGVGAADPSRLSWWYRGETATTNAWNGYGYGLVAFAETTDGSVAYWGWQPAAPQVYWDNQAGLQEIASRAAVGGTEGETTLTTCLIANFGLGQDWDRLKIEPVAASNLTFGFTRNVGGIDYTTPHCETNAFEVAFGASVVRSARSRFTAAATESGAFDGLLRRSLWDREMVLSARVLDLQCVFAARDYLPDSDWFAENEPDFWYDDAADASERSRKFRLGPMLQGTHVDYYDLVAAAAADASTLRNQLLADFAAISQGRSVHAADWCREDAVEDVAEIQRGSIQLRALALPSEDSALMIRAVLHADGSLASASAYWAGSPGVDLVKPQGLHIGYIQVETSGERTLSATNCASASASDRALVCPTWNFRNLVDRLDIAN